MRDAAKGGAVQMPELMRTEEAAEYLRIHPETLRKKVRAGRIGAFKVGREWRFAKAQLNDWLAFGGVKLKDASKKGGTRRAPGGMIKSNRLGVGYGLPRIQAWADDELGRSLTEDELIDLQEAIEEKYGQQIAWDILDFIESAAATASAPGSLNREEKRSS
jgi:excisionase family DNA binding protein